MKKIMHSSSYRGGNKKISIHFHEENMEAWIHITWEFGSGENHRFRSQKFNIPFKRGVGKKYDNGLDTVCHKISATGKLIVSKTYLDDNQRAYAGESERPFIMTAHLERAGLISVKRPE